MEREREIERKRERGAAESIEKSEGGEKREEEPLSLFSMHTCTHKVHRERGRERKREKGRAKRRFSRVVGRRFYVGASAMVTNVIGFTQLPVFAPKVHKERKKASVKGAKKGQEKGADKEKEKNIRREKTESAREF